MSFVVGSMGGYHRSYSRAQIRRGHSLRSQEIVKKGSPKGLSKESSSIVTVRAGFRIAHSLGHQSNAFAVEKALFGSSSIIFLLATVEIPKEA